MHPTVKLALSLLLQAPQLASSIDLPISFEKVKLEGIEIFHRILSIINQNPKHTTGTLLEHFSQDPLQPTIVELAAHDLLIPLATWQDEIQGVLLRIKDHDNDQCIQVLLAKGSKEGLTIEEKKLLQQLLSIRK
jgi:hypothetical protein